ncbi:Ubiquitin carboxyl-terminal hydrolase 5 [Toxocara canis]|uniref:ubiquitinyl hydrolase 1 n=1 Tax=Toxocara canis TaxID=6265 RepID=A0A0B2UVC3_TOXCA|nr:Ubiquitin carboxyl-terminal hydrolase 5 [Toxocara canis]
MSEAMEIGSRSVDSETISSKMLDALSYRCPSSATKIFKDECMQCFNTPLHPGGLFVCMKTFAGLCPKHVAEHCERTGQRALLHIQQTKLELAETEGPQDKVTKLAIDVEGGFRSTPRTETVTEYSLSVYPAIQTKIPFDKLSGDLLIACTKVATSESAQRVEQLETGVSGWDGEAKLITKHVDLPQVATSESAQRVEQLETGVSGWDGEAKLITKHVDLPQLNNGVKVPRSGWKCQAEGCELTENLWLNLTDGAIKCGRSQYIQEGVLSKGNNHMRQHYDNTGYPLVVKLGTITKDDADVFSYDEDESVRDPNLAKHLMHFDIDLQTVEKTEKSTLELELDLNQKWEWAMCQEDGANLELAYGPALTGMINIDR